MRINFEKITFKSTKQGICPKCGKRAQRTGTFWQTINPFNKNPDGTIKTDKEIQHELISKMREWQRKPVFHVKCE